MSEPILAIEDLETCYGLSQVLFGISLTIAPGEMVTLMGRNGMGKTTTVRSIMGLTPARAGRVRFAGEEIRGLPAYKVAQCGIGLVPEGRQIFPNLTVRENLVATAAGTGQWTLERVHDLFPRLAERAGSMGNQLSGGEQQMLAIARALMTNPSLLLLDEPAAGVPQEESGDIFEVVAGLSDDLTLLFIEHDMHIVFRFATHIIVLVSGAVFTQGTPKEIAADPAVREVYLGTRKHG